MKLKYSLILLSSVLLSACSDNANLRPLVSPATSETDSHSAVILYSGYDYQIHRVNINGVNYLCNTKGGIIRE